jgi:hypothetical protein
MPAKAPIEAFCADPIAAAQDAVLADATLFGLIGRKILLGDRHEGGVVEPIDRRRHVAIDVNAFGDELAFVVLAGERQQHARLDHAEIAGAEDFAFSRGQRAT